MYDWLTDALEDDSAQIVTANRRLARTLRDHYGRKQLEAGLLAWRRPPIYAWDDWLAVLVDTASNVDGLPVRINAQQSRVLWERCLQQDIADPLIHIGGLARLCRDTWRRLHEWRVPLQECQQRANGRDQRIFARAAGHYARRLDDDNWIDRAQLPELIVGLMDSGDIAPAGNIVLAGFDRITPQAQHLIDTAVSAGAKSQIIHLRTESSAELRRYENADAELRAAGAWARAELEKDPAFDVAIIVSNLEQDAQHSGRILREGLTPGWQYGDEQYVAALNVSFGRALADYPAIQTALLVLRWLHNDLRSAEVSRLLLSPVLGSGTFDGRARLELRLREWPDRHWSRELLLRAFERYKQDATDWIDRFETIDERLSAAPRRGRPSEWAAVFDDVLRVVNWPGDGTLSSADFQLNNRWRELLNDFSRIELVSPTMSGTEAVIRLASIAAETIFQAEADDTRVNVLGPLEAAGMSFDRLWVSGLAASDWPPPERPLALLSRDLQRNYGMPDATPGDTSDYAQRVIRRLSGSADEVIFSYPAMIGDAEQSPTELLRGMSAVGGEGDPGWHAQSFCGSVVLEELTDRVPVVRADEKIAGGAATINRHFSDPFASFVYGRLGVRWLKSFRPGIEANVRGSLIHDALYELYRDKPSQVVIRGWSVADVSSNLRRAVAAAFRRHERYADSVLEQLLRLEKRRTERLLKDVIDVDRQRAEFAVDSVENGIETTIGGIHLELRCDRIDRLPDGSYVVLDYKTGKKRKFLSGGEPGDRQLIVYACAIRETINGLGLFNVDGRLTAIDGAGPAFDSGDDWPHSLIVWKQQVRAAAEHIAAGDVRLRLSQPNRDARPLSLLSRFAEVRRGS